MNAYSLKNVEIHVESFILNIESHILTTGEIYSVTGPNGSGKSTFLNTLAFLETPKYGIIEFMKEQVDYTKPDRIISLRRNVSYLLQIPYLFNTTVRKNVSFGLRIRNMPSHVINEKTDTILKELSLTHLANRSAHSLSGGEAQRVALARTLVLPTDVILLDEPTANVDRSNVSTVESLIKKIAHERGATVILTTHSSKQAQRMSSNLIPIVGGRIC